MELDWLETFLAVVDHGGFTAAAEQVHRSQSRVSAHIAGLERELGVRLIDRNRRPARITTAGEVFAGHAREIVAGLGSARSAVRALRTMEQERLCVLTTPCIGTALFPGVIAWLAEQVPGVRVDVREEGRYDVERRFADDGVVLAVLPTPARPPAPGLREQVLWRECVQVVVPRAHPFARQGSAVRPDQLGTVRLVVSGPAGEGEREVLSRLAQPRATVDTPQTLVEMVRAGVGVGVANAVALEHVDTSGLAVLDIDDPGMVREVGAYWYDVLLTTAVGGVLHRAVLDAPPPRGALPVHRRAATSGAPRIRRAPPTRRQ